MRTPARLAGSSGETFLILNGLAMVDLCSGSLDQFGKRALEMRVLFVTQVEAEASLVIAPAAAQPCFKIGDRVPSRCRQVLLDRCQRFKHDIDVTESAKRVRKQRQLLLHPPSQDHREARSKV